MKHSNMENVQLYTSAQVLQRVWEIVYLGPTSTGDVKFSIVCLYADGFKLFYSVCQVVNMPAITTHAPRTYTRGVQKVLQLSMMHKWHKQNFYVII